MIAKVYRFRHLPPSVDHVQAVVGGTVDLMEIYGGRQLLFCADGGPLNAEATALAGHAVYGNAVILEGSALWRIRNVQMRDLQKDVQPWGLSPQAFGVQDRPGRKVRS